TSNKKEIITTIDPKFYFLSFFSSLFSFLGIITTHRYSHIYNNKVIIIVIVILYIYQKK
ncbi:hypothetical protein BDC45DRAFT_462849, partial [Circinella umbellata]